ncbi:MAG: complex I NDUFA9 subunit family protein [Pseudomonadota bacterium]
MSSSDRPVVVFGGSGFLGRAIVACLVDAGHTVRIATRRAADHAGSVEWRQADIRDEASVSGAIEGCAAVVNAVGLYAESKTERFEATHEGGARIVARQAAQQGVEQLVHISGIGADPASRSSYVRARARGEALVQEAYPAATILRPSALFGPDDALINGLADLARRAPFVPLFGRGQTRLQPVYVGDVARAAVGALSMPSARGKVFELGGPRIYTYRGLLALVLDAMGKRRPMAPVPFTLWDLVAAVSAVLPSPPITEAQVTLMRADNVVSGDMPSLLDLGIEPTALESVLPGYRLSSAAG